jgi:hypothetical protein
MINPLKLIIEFESFIKEYWGQHFIKLIEMILIIFSLNAVLTHIGNGFEYSALLNYFLLVIFTLFLGLIDKRREDK